MPAWPLSESAETEHDAKIESIIQLYMHRPLPDIPASRASESKQSKMTSTLQVHDEHQHPGIRLPTPDPDHEPRLDEDDDAGRQPSTPTAAQVPYRRSVLGPDQGYKHAAEEYHALLREIDPSTAVECTIGSLDPVHEEPEHPTYRDKFERQGLPPTPPARSPLRVAPASRTPSVGSTASPAPDNTHNHYRKCCCGSMVGSGHRSSGSSTIRLLTPISIIRSSDEKTPTKDIVVTTEHIVASSASSPHDRLLKPSPLECAYGFYDEEDDSDNEYHSFGHLTACASPSPPTLPAQDCRSRMSDSGLMLKAYASLQKYLSIADQRQSAKPSSPVATQRAYSISSPLHTTCPPNNPSRYSSLDSSRPRYIVRSKVDEILGLPDSCRPFSASLAQSTSSMPPRLYMATPSASSTSGASRYGTNASGGSDKQWFLNAAQAVADIPARSRTKFNHDHPWTTKRKRSSGVALKRALNERDISILL